jgi:hypothetical protein
MGASQISGGNFRHRSLRSIGSCSSAHQCPASSVLLHPESSVLQSPAPSVQSPRGHRGVSFGVVGQDSGRVALHSEGSHSMLSATSEAGARSTCTRRATALPTSTKQQAIGVGTCASSTTTVWSIGIFVGSHSRRTDQCSPLSSIPWTRRSCPSLSTSGGGRNVSTGFAVRVWWSLALGHMDSAAISMWAMNGASDFCEVLTRTIQHVMDICRRDHIQPPEHLVVQNENTTSQEVPLNSN